MSAILFVENNPYYFDYHLSESTDWGRIRDQAIEHTRYKGHSGNIRTARPNEPENITEYREDNQRRLTKAVIDKFKTKTSRIIRSSGLSINESSLSDALIEYLEQKNYLYLNRPTDFETYFFEYVYTQSIDDPNAVEILLPYNPLNPNVSPLVDVMNGGLPKNEFVPIKKLIVPSDQIAAFNSEVFSWYGGEMTLPNSTENVSYRWYWVVDKEWFYRYLPVRKDPQTHKVIYELEAWYFHDTGIGDRKMLPVNVLLGDLVIGESGEYAYQSSILSGFFEYGDEFISRFSDGQAVWVTSSFPIHVMEEMLCTADGCYQGKVRNPNYKIDNNAPKTTACTACRGTGFLDRPSQYGVLIRKDKTSLEGSNNTGKPYEIISPSEGLVRVTFEQPFELLKKGEKQIGLDVLENAIESGVSRAMRFEDVKDKLADVSQKIVDYWSLHLLFTECLLVPNRSQRSVPKVNTPVDFQLKSSIDLREDVEKALPSDRLEKNLAYYRNLYKNNEPLIRVFELAFKYAPTLIDPTSEVLELLNVGVIKENDLVRRQYAVTILKEMSKMPNFMTQTEETIFARIDQVLTDKGLFVPETLALVDANGEPNGEA